jgi:tetratricopeptide (TPR) repeat protein
MDRSGIRRSLGELSEKLHLLGLILAVATLFLYLPVAHHGFLEYDDPLYVVKNSHINTGFSLQNLSWAFTGFVAGHWHPLTCLSHMLDCQLFGLNAGAHHLVNVAFHIANVLLLFWLLRSATGAVWRSFLVAGLFAFHPLNVETVAWIAERKSLLCTLFSLLTIAAYGWYARRRCGKRYLLLVAVFALALMAKAMAVTLPLVFLLLDYWPLERGAELPWKKRWLPLFLEKGPLLLMSAADSVVTIIGQRSFGASGSVKEFPVSYRAENVLVSYAAYIGKALWPSRLAVFYPHEASFSAAEVIVSAILLAAVSLAVVRWRRHRYLVVGWLFFLMTMLPVIGIVQVGKQAIADHFTYFPCIGLFLLAAWGLSELAEWNPAMSDAAPAVAACVVLGFATVTTGYLKDWKNGILLFEHAQSVTSRPSVEIEEGLADAYRSTGQLELAYQHYSKACEISPRYGYCHYDMGYILLMQHKPQEALKEYRLAAMYAQNSKQASEAWGNSAAILLLELGDRAGAERALANALQLDPANSAALALRGYMQNQTNPGNGQPPPGMPRGF